MLKIKIKAILFDLDGVLVDTLHYHFLAWQKQFEKLGGIVSEHTVLMHEGRNSREILPVLLKEAGIFISEEDYDSFIEGKRKYYRQIVDVKFYPGAIDVIEELKLRGFKMAIVTACAQKTMKKSLDDRKRKLFDLIQTGDDVPRAKPNPDPYDSAREKLGLQPMDCLVIENAPLGISSAKRAGMECVAVETTLDKKYLKEADYIISDIKELLNLRILDET
jgi:beta-phosphoglucomutase